MTVVKNIRLGLIHVAVAISLVPITGVLNRIMIHELGLMASLVAGLIVLPHLLSPLQPFLGQYSDHHPLMGYRRTPYIALGLVLCVGGAVLTPMAALAMDTDFWPGLLFAIVAFLTWGMGYNLSVVSYLSLASDLSGEQQRSRTIAVMWFMMITGVIGTAIITGRALEHYTPEGLVRVFMVCGAVSLVIGAIGLVGLEPRGAVAGTGARHSAREAVGAVLGNPQAQAFFVYLMLLLAAILGQDVLLEPFGAQAFGMSVRETTQLTATWGGATLLALLLQGLVLSRYLSKRAGASLGAAVAATGFLLIALSGILGAERLFVPGIAILGFGTGIATTTNLAMMLDMTTPSNVGLFIGAWGVADAAARGLGNLMAGVLRDIMSATLGSATGGYIVVFLIEGLMLCVALVLLRRIDVSAFRGEQQSITTLIAVAGDA
ncbi:MAG: BCD family MFS transporter [Chloroflexales bacterium]|nr:BCD family MFS transporter [Chloroflexales bacterium]